MDSLTQDFFERLKDTFFKNFKLTRLYASYLENYPEIITRDMVDTLCEGGFIGKDEAIVALLSEIFGLRQEDSEDRYIIRNYLAKSVRILDSKKYENNPYYANIKIPSIKRGRWEFKQESYKPYRGVICSDVIIERDYSETPPLGFFEKEFFFPAVLEDGNEWMTLTPVDLDTCEVAINEATGEVITFGLGLGYYAYMVSEKSEVNRVTVIEKSQEVISLFKEYILPQFTHPEKIRIINEDAFLYAEKEMPKENYTYAFVDTWRDASDGAPMYRRMKAYEGLNPNTKFSYWIENFLISRIRAENFYELLDLEERGEFDMRREEIISFLDKLN